MKILLLTLSCIYLQRATAGPLDSHSHNITFSVAGKSLPSQDNFSPPDPLIKIYSFTKSGSPDADNYENQLQLVGSTDYIRDEHNPDWNEVFAFRWYRGTGQTWRVKAYDHDHTNTDDLIGTADVSVDRFMESQGNLTVDLSRGGFIFFKRTMPIAFKLSAKNLPPRDRYIGSNGISDPYAIISYLDISNGTEKEIYKTEVLTDNAHPTWPETIEFAKYQPNAHQTLHFQLWDRDLFSRDEFLGEAFISADELTERSGSVIIPLENSEGGASIVLKMPHHQQQAHTETSVDLHLTSSLPHHTPPIRDSASTEYFYHHNDHNNYENEIHDEHPK